MTQENILPGERSRTRRALLTARAAAHLASLQVEMTQENILPGERAGPRRSATHSARRRSLGLFAGRKLYTKIFYRESVRGRVEALLTARAAVHLASLQVENILPWKSIFIFPGKFHSVTDAT